jgi:hypothetical protein
VTLRRSFRLKRYDVRFGQRQATGEQNLRIGPQGCDGAIERKVVCVPVRDLTDHDTKISEAAHDLDARGNERGVCVGHGRIGCETDDQTCARNDDAEFVVNGIRLRVLGRERKVRNSLAGGCVLVSRETGERYLNSTLKAGRAW